MRRNYPAVVVVVRLGTVAEDPTDVVVVVLGSVVVVVVEGVLAAGDGRVVVVVVPVGAVVLVDVVVVVDGVAPPVSPPKKVCPEPGWSRTTAESGFCTTSSMMVSVAMAITSTATMAPRTGTRMLRQLLWGGRRCMGRPPCSVLPSLARPASPVGTGRSPRGGGYGRACVEGRSGRCLAACRSRAWARRIEAL